MALGNHLVTSSIWGDAERSGAKRGRLRLGGSAKGWLRSATGTARRAFSSSAAVDGKRRVAGDEPYVAERVPERRGAEAQRATQQLVSDAHDVSLRVLRS